jgi:LPS export ABC transporter protein LptC
MMLDRSRLIQLVIFLMLAILSYGIYDNFFGEETTIEFEPFTKGYSLEGVIIKNSDEHGDIVSTIESPSMIHYADTEVSIINNPKYTMHEPEGDWVFTSSKGEINKDQTELYFPNKVNLFHESGTDENVSIVTRELKVDVVAKLGKGKGKITVAKPGLLMTGLGSVINFTDQSVEILENMYAEFEN